MAADEPTVPPDPNPRAATIALLERLLGPADEALALREVLDRLFDSHQADLAHDAMSISFLNHDQTHIEVYARSGALRDLPVRLESPIADPTLVTRPWDFEVIGDQREHEHYRTMPSAKAGMRSAIVIPLRFAGRLRGWVNFFSAKPHAFMPAQAPTARRLAAHVALALSYELLAEQGRRHEELRVRAANLELLDDLLATLVNSGDLPDLFGRVSAIAGKVLVHDAAALTVYLPDGKRARVYANSGFPRALPEIIDLPPDLVVDVDRDYDLFDDLKERREERYKQLNYLGFNSLIRVPIRFEQRTAGALIFLSRSLAAFRHPDILVANRIADRMAVTMARSRELEASKRADEAADRAAALEARVRSLTDELDTRTGFRRVVGDSPQWKQVLTQAAQVAPTEVTVLLLGDSGTGKEVVARFVHRASQHSAGPFIALNCAALPEHLLEAELFGYERGAFTGATQSKPGQLEQAAGGTLFLDEVGEMSLPAQAKLLRVLQEREFQRLGGTRVLRTDARIIAATNRDLQTAIRGGVFREDLYYRLNVFAIRLPRLRDRREDILPLSEAFLVEIGKSFGRPPAGISRQAKQILTEYEWPGNVRELRNILERAAILCDRGLITEEHLALDVSSPARPAQHDASAIPSVPATESAATESPVATGALPPREGAAATQSARPPDIATMERAMIEEALNEMRFNKSKAAKKLGLTRHQLYIRMRRHGLE